MIYYLLYILKTGAIFGYETSPSVDLPDGWGSLTVEIDGAVPTSLTHRVVDHTLVELSQIERANALAPTASEVRAIISEELASTDQYMVPDRPLLDQQRSAWIAYRQAIRDLSKPQDDLGRAFTAVEMVTAWPSRPDGVDPVAAIRVRMEQV